MSDHTAFIKTALTRPIVLIGLMGAGKTKIGALLAQALEIAFVDADHEIERAANMSVADIFESHGEPAFRDLERRVLARLLSDDTKIIATGGGAVMNEQTAQTVWDQSLSIWLKADLDVLLERTGRNEKRPLLKQGDPREVLQKLIDLRYPVYAQADIAFETDHSEPEDALVRLLPVLAKYLEESAP